MNYAWVVLGALVVITAASIVLAGPALSFFIPAMQADLAIPMFYFGLAMSTRQLCFGLMSPVLGRMIDRFSPRAILMFVGVVSGIAVYTLSEARTGWHLIVLIGILGAVGLQGAGGDLYGSVVIARWFRENRGKAMSIAFVGMPAGIFFLTPLTQWLIETEGWKSTWQLFGIVGGSVVFFAALLLRNPPKAEETPAEGSEPVWHEVSWTRAEAVRTSAFWKVAVAFGILMFTISTVAMFRVPHFVSQGMDAQLVAYAFSVEALISALAAIPVGYLIDRYKIHYLTAGAFTLPIIMLIMTIYATTNVEVFTAMIVFGLGAASCIILQNTIWPAYFGHEHLGSIRGLSMPITLGFSILGAPIAGWVRDQTGSFDLIWWVTSVAMLVAIALIVTTPKPEHPDST